MKYHTEASTMHIQNCIIIMKRNCLLCCCNCSFGDAIGGVEGMMEAASGFAVADSSGIGGKPT